MLALFSGLPAKLAVAGFGVALVVGLVAFALIERAHATADVAKLRQAQGQLAYVARINAHNLTVERAKNAQLAQAAAASLTFQHLNQQTTIAAASLGGQIEKASAAADSPAAPIIAQAFAGIGASP